MKLSTGNIAFPIEFDNGDKGEIFFNPHDREFVDRIMNFEKSIENRIQKINIDKYKDRLKVEKAVNINLDNIEELMNMTEEQMAEVRENMSAIMEIDAEYQTALKDEMNDIFKSDVSSVIFKHCEPMDMVVLDDGTSEMFIVHFIKAFAMELKAYTDKVSPAMQKHLGKYAK